MIFSSFSSTIQPTFVTTFAQENQTGTENEAEIEADIEQENKCKDDSECVNENEINNSLDIITTGCTQNTTQQEEQTQLIVTKIVECQSSDDDPFDQEVCDFAEQSTNHPNPEDY